MDAIEARNRIDELDKSFKYMAGEYLLVAPLFKGQTERKVVLPRGKWFDFYTGKLAGEGTFTITSGLDKIPLFVRDGGMIPMISPIRQTSEWTNDKPLIVKVYGKADGHFALYNDDGKTFNFEKGEYSVQLLELKQGKGTVKHSGDAGFGYSGITWKFMTQ